MGSPKEVERASLRSLVSGLVSAAADNDPTTVATVAIAGATLTYGLEWLLVLVIPMFMVVQAIGTQVAAVSREGLQATIRDRYGQPAAWASLACIACVNVLTYAADLGAGSASLNLISHIDARWWLLPLSLAVGMLLAYGSVEKVRLVLTLLPLAFLAYVAAAFLARPDWHTVAAGFVPQLAWNHGNVAIAIALIGTTLTVYSFYWQTIEVAQDAPPPRALLPVQLAALPGTLITGGVLWFILIATGATLGVHHHAVQTARDAAQALAPAAGKWASIVFGIGLLGSSLLALPVIAAGMGYAVTSTVRWPGSIDARPREARRYYAVIFAGIGLGTALAFAPLSPIALLFAASIAAGFATPLTLGMLVALGRDEKTMGRKKISPLLASAGWFVTAVVALAALSFAVYH